MADWNSKIIEEFRGNEGKVGGPFEGAPLLLLHTVGARTGQPRVNPMMYRPVPGGRVPGVRRLRDEDHQADPGGHPRAARLAPGTVRK